MIYMADTIISAEQYNAIEDLTDQQQDIPATALDRLASVFVQHQMHHNHCIELLHRHLQLHPGNLMAHIRPKPDIYICGLRTFDPSHAKLCPFTSYTDHKMAAFNP